MSSTPLPPVLIVTVYSHYVAPARMPRELKAAGFPVAVLAPHDSLVTQTRHADRIDLLPDDLPLDAFLRALGDSVREVRPRLILPGDDIVVRLMMQTVLTFAPRGEPGATALVPLIIASLGDPSRYATSIDKGLLTERARKIGIPVAAGETVRTPSEGVRVANSLGYPVIVRATVGTAGSASCSASTTSAHRPRGKAARSRASAGAAWRPTRPPSSARGPSRSTSRCPRSRRSIARCSTT